MVSLQVLASQETPAERAYRLVPAAALFALACRRADWLDVRQWAALCSWLDVPWAEPPARLGVELRQRLGVKRLGAADSRASLQRLRADSLLDWQRGLARFPVPPVAPHVRRRWQSQLEWDRPVRVTVAQLDWIARCSSGVRGGALLVLLLRCSWPNGGGGRCRAGLVAEILGCTPQEARRALAELVDQGVAERAPERRSAARQDHGALYRLRPCPPATPDRRRRFPPPQGPLCAFFPPQRTDTSSDPDLTGNAACRPIRPEPEPRPSQRVPRRHSQAPSGRVRQGPHPRRQLLPRAARDDLRQRRWLEEAHRIAARAGAVSSGPAGLSEVATLAQRALRCARRNAPGYLYRLLELPASARGAAQIDEDRARSLLRADAGGGPAEGQAAVLAAALRLAGAFRLGGAAAGSP